MSSFSLSLSTCLGVFFWKEISTFLVLSFITPYLRYPHEIIWGKGMCCCGWHRVPDRCCLGLCSHKVLSRHEWIPADREVESPVRFTGAGVTSNMYDILRRPHCDNIGRQLLELLIPEDWAYQPSLFWRRGSETNSPTLIKSSKDRQASVHRIRTRRRLITFD